jgi:hypothetical protein
MCLSVTSAHRAIKQLQLLPYRFQAVNLLHHRDTAARIQYCNCFRLLCLKGSMCIVEDFIVSWSLGENQSEERFATGWGVWGGADCIRVLLGVFGRVTRYRAELTSVAKYVLLSCSRVRWFRPNSQWQNSKTWQHYTLHYRNDSYRCQTATEGFSWRLSLPGYCDWLLHVPAKVKLHKERNEL